MIIGEYTNPSEVGVDRHIIADMLIGTQLQYKVIYSSQRNVRNKKRTTALAAAGAVMASRTIVAVRNPTISVFPHNPVNRGICP